MKFHSPASNDPDWMPIAAYVVDPPGFEEVPLPLNADLTVALGREIRVEVMGDTRWFKTWWADNTLIDGSPQAADVFRLGNANQLVAAWKRGWESVSVGDPPNLTVSCEAVGELADAMWSFKDPVRGGRYYILPEGTYLRVNATGAAIKYGQHCTAGFMYKTSVDGTHVYANVQTSHRTTGLFRPERVSRIEPSACCCESGKTCWCWLYGVFTYHKHTFNGTDGVPMFAAPAGENESVGPRHVVGSAITRSVDDPPNPFSHELYYGFVEPPGYQYLCSAVFDWEGTLIDVKWPSPFGTGAGSVVATRDTAPISMKTYTTEKPTLTVDIEVEDDIVPPAEAGYYSFDNMDYAGGKSSYKRQVDYPYPQPDVETELIAVNAAPHDGFVFKAWTGDCAYFDQYGNYLGMLPKTLPEDPEDWITDETIYVKCLRAEYPMMASSTSDMAVLAGANVYGAAVEPTLTANNARATAHMKRMRGVLIRGGDWDPPTIFLHSLPRLKYHARAKLGYAVRSHFRPSLSMAQGMLRDKAVEVFQYVGHGHGLHARITIQYPGVYLFPADVAEIFESPFVFVFLNTCFQGLFMEEWMEAFDAASFVGFRTIVYWDAAQEFDAALWSRLCDVNEVPDVYLAYSYAREQIRNHIVEGVKNDPVCGGNHEFPGHVGTAH